MRIVRDDPKEAWAYVPRYAQDIRCAYSNGRLAWGFQGPEAECPYPEGDARRKAWGMGFNAARRGLNRNEASVIRHFRERGEIH